MQTRRLSPNAHCFDGDHVPETQQGTFVTHDQINHAFELQEAESLAKMQHMHSIMLLQSEMTEEDFLKWVGQKLETMFLRHSALSNRKIKKVAVLGGSGSFAIPAAKQIKADALVTADLKYHDFFQAENRILLVDGGHYETERFTKKLIHDHLIEKLPNFAVALSKQITNPVKYFSDGKKE